MTITKWPLDGSTYFNNCTNHAEPDWTQFDAIEIGGCTVDYDENGEPADMHGGYDRDEADIFTVYGHYREGLEDVGLEAITDCATLEDAERIADVLAERAGLPVYIMC